MTAATAVEALGFAQERHPDVVLSDIAMVGHDGYWLLREICALADDRASHVPVVATTAYGREHSQQAALDAGFIDYLSKPVDPDVLYHAVARAAGH